MRGDGPGRVAGFEIMFMTPAISNLIRKNETFRIPSSIQTGAREGMVTLDDYLLVNVAASYKLDDRITLFGRVENMLDSEYEEVYGYTSAPAAAYAGLKVEFTDEAPLEPGK